MTASFILVELAVTLTWSALSPFTSGGWYVPFGLAGAGTGLLGAMALRRGQLGLAGHVTMVAAAGAAFSGGIFTGGIANPAFAWLFFVPLFAGLMLDIAGATVWSLITGAVALATVYLHQAHRLPASVYEPMTPIQPVIDVAAMAVVALVVMRLYQQASVAAQTKLSTALDDLRGEVEERRRAEEQARAARTAQESFLASISHEIRTPMNGIIGITELLTRSTLSDDQRAHVEALTRSAITLRRLLSDLLDLSKLRSGGFTTQREPLDLYGVLGGVMQLQQAATPAVEVQLTRGPDVPRFILGDESRLTQSLGNLVANAGRFAERRVQVTTQWAAASLTVLVDDDGPGIPEDQRETVLLPFQQVDGTVGGTGLGLAVVAGLANAMGGSLGFEESPLGGARARLILPAPLSDAVEEPTEVRSGPPLRVLVVDDDEVNQLVLGGLLESLNAAVEPAMNGEQALTMLRAVRFDMVLMDLQMPGIDGLEATRRARADGYDGPILCLTASSAARIEDEVHDAGMDGLLTKPVSRRQLATALMAHGMRT